MNARSELPLGIHDGMPIDEYHASAGVSNSGLGDFAQSPFHFHALHINPNRPPRETKAGQLEGNLAHCLILEPASFAERYAVGPCDDRRLAAWKAWENHRDHAFEAIKPSEYETARAQAESVRSLTDVAKLLAAGRPEVSAYWIDPATGELCRCRPDWVHPVSERSVVLADVKTCSDASPREFARQVARKGYHRQAAFYSDGYAIAAGVQVLGFVFIAVESTWPFAACACMLDDESLEKGREDNRELLARFAECRRTDTWPAYSESIELINLPRWAA